jgi:hypothetical protein
VKPNGEVGATQVKYNPPPPRNLRPPPRQPAPRQPPSAPYVCTRPCSAIPKPVCVTVEGGEPNDRESGIQFTMHNECVAYCQGFDLSSITNGACQFDLDANKGLLPSANFTTPRDSKCCVCK